MNKFTSSAAPPATLLLSWSFRVASIFCAIAPAMAFRLENKAPVASEILARIPLHFEPQADGTFVSRGLGYSLWLGPEEVALRLENSSASTGGIPALVRLRFSKANPKPQMEAVDRLPGVSNYYRGNDPSKWRTGVPQFAKVRYRENYPGIDLVFYGRGRELEFDLVVAPGADPNQIRIEVEGADETTLDRSGNLVLQTEAGPLRLRKPLVYQETEIGREEITARFTVQTVEPQSGLARSQPEVSFQVAKYDRARPLIIDPIFDFDAGIGGTRIDKISAVDIARSGTIYLAGSTASTDLLVSALAEQKALRGDLDALIAAISRDGAQLLSMTYFGGRGNDEALGIAIDQFDLAHVTGYTQSDDLPVSKSLPQTYGGNGDAFVAAFDLSGVRIYSAYFGGSDVDQGDGIDVDPGGNIYFCGTTRSTDLPVVNALQPSNAGSVDVFVAKLNPSSSALAYATYLGGSFPDHPNGLTPFVNSSERGTALAVDAAGNAYITGGTFSSNFPKVNAYRPSGAGVFLSKLNVAGSALLYSTTIGEGAGLAIDVNDSGLALIGGVTTGPDGFFPVRNAIQATYRGRGDGFFAEIDTTKSGDASLTRASFLGGDAHDQVNSIRLLKRFAQDVREIVGTTDSPDFPFTSERVGGSILKSSDLGATWSKFNKGLVSADSEALATQVNRIAVDPANAQIAYAGTEFGVFKTTDAGANWAAINNGLGSAFLGVPAVTGLGIDPSNSSRIFAGTASNGIYVTENGGANWTQRNNGLAGQTNIPFVTFAFGGGFVFAGSEFNGVFRTADNGALWTAINNGLTDLRVNTLAVNLAKNRLLAGTGGRSSPSGIYGKTLTGDGDWQHYNGNLSNVMGPLGPSGFTDLVITSILTFGDFIYALVQSSPERIGGLALSGDFGQTWAALARFGDPAQTPDPTFGFENAYSARTFWVDPNNTNHILIGTNGDPGFLATAPEAKDGGRGIIRSTDGGATWSVTGSVGITVNDLGFAAADVVYAGTAGGSDGFVTTVPADGSAPSTDIVGGTGTEALSTVARGENKPSVSAGSTASSDLAPSTGAVTAPPNTVPPGMVIGPVQAQNGFLFARPVASPPPTEADLEVAKQCTITQFGGRTGVLCTITVKNNGPGAGGVKLNEYGNHFETPVEDVSDPVVPGSFSPLNGNTRTYEMGTIAPGSSKVVRLFYPVFNSNGKDLGKFRGNRAVVSVFDDNNVRDLNVLNDEDVEFVDIPQGPPGSIPPQTANQSTRVVAGSGDNAPNSGTIITGSQQQQQQRNRPVGPNASANQKKVIFRAIGPSLSSVPGRLADPTMELYDSNGTIIGRNDNWKQTIIGGVITSDQVAEIEASTIPPSNDLESAIVANLSPGRYTTVIRGVGDATGIGLAEVYDLDSAGSLRLANISTRGFVDTGDNVMIGGIILLGQSSQRIVFRAIGPSLTPFGVPGALQNPALTVFDGNGAVVRSNDNWRSDQEAELIATTIPPTHDDEAAIVVNLPPGPYTAVVSGVGNTTGVGLLEVYNLGAVSP